MLFGKFGIPGLVGYDISNVFSMMTKQIQFSKMITHATKSQNIITNVVWGTRDPGAFGIFNFLCMPNGKQTDSILPNDNHNRQIRKYNNYSLGYAIPLIF